MVSASRVIILDTLVPDHPAEFYVLTKTNEEIPEMAHSAGLFYDPSELNLK